MPFASVLGSGNPAFQFTGHQERARRNQRYDLRLLVGQGPCKVVNAPLCLLILRSVRLW
jgi:hypothetical protein